jgi:hypothetical protein
MALGDITSILSLKAKEYLTMRQSAKAKNIQTAENSLLQSQYNESQLAFTDKALEEAVLLQGLSLMPIKYIPRKMTR